MSYKINESIKVYYRAVGAESSITDLQFITTNPSGTDIDTINMTEVTNYPGLYLGSFTPNANGRWWIRLKSTTNPENVYSVSYLVGGVLNTTALYDHTGTNPVAVEQTVNGDYHLATHISQDVFPDPDNSSTTNLTSANSHTFTGTGTTTLGVVGLQWNLKTDQNATVYIEQSDDNVNWDISDAFDYIVGYSSGGNTVQAVTSYWRIRVVLTGTTDTTYFRLAGVLCPIASPLPRALSHGERLKTCSTITSFQDNNRHAWVSLAQALLTSPKYRLVGKYFVGSNKDTNFWTETVTNGGTVVQSGGEIILNTNTTANGTARYESNERARFIVGSPLEFCGMFKVGTNPEADNLRRIGAYDDDNGLFFQINGTTTGVGSRADGSDTIVTSGNFNGHYGMVWNPSVDTYYQIKIEMSLHTILFYVNGTLLHKLSGAGYTETFELPVRLENNNSNGVDTANISYCMGTAISRHGESYTHPISKWIDTNTTTVCKYGAGMLHRIVVADNAGSIDIYDNTAGSGTVIAELDTAQGIEPAYTVEFGTSFSNGLTIVTAASAKLTVVYE